MRHIYSKLPRRALAVALISVFSLGLLPAGALAADVTPACDETYYATLDPYGTLLDSSVVKSYRTFGQSVIQDYGSYSQVINLTDDRLPADGDGGVTFDLSGSVPERFYFEGKTAKPFEEFPWSLRLSYSLNGVPVQAEQLAGKSGVVEITLDATPNPRASAYSRNNLVLTAVSAFNGDDLLSLEAPGAQVQLLGNLYCVLYAVLPGEEQHFTLRVGCDDFSYSGMMFLAVPATLEQLEQVAELRDMKEETEDSYHALNDSMHAVLDAMEGMSGSLNAAASGIDQLNQARAVISDGKDKVYAQTDSALESVAALAAALEPLAAPVPEEPEVPVDPEASADPEAPSGPAVDTGLSGGVSPTDGLPAQPEGGTVGHLPTARQALSETRTLLNEMSRNLTGLRPEVEKTRQLLLQIQDDVGALQNASNETEFTSYSLSQHLSSLQSSLNTLSRALGSAGGVSNVPPIQINGMTVAQIRAAVAQANAAHSQYEAAQQGGMVPPDMSFEAFLINVAHLDAATAQQTAALYQKAQSPDFDSQLAQADSANSMISGVNDKLSEVNGLIGALTSPTGAVVSSLSVVTGDLAHLTHVLNVLLEDTSAVGNLDQALNIALRTSEHADLALEQLESLTGIMNTYEPQLQQAITDSETIVISATDSLNALTGAVRSAEDLLKQSGPSLDAGTKQTLSGVSAALRKSTAGLEQTYTMRSALDTIDALISDQWDSHTGQDNNLLLMDASARPESLTDRRNQGTASIQYVMRSQEITAETAGQDDPEPPPQADKGTFWSRVKAMFHDIWTAITSLF